MVIGNKFIAIEGIDGAGKRTQIELLSAALNTKHIRHTVFSFPRYDSFMGRMVGRFLDGDFGPLDQVDPHFSALLFAGDRLEASEKLWEVLKSGGGIVADRYIGSNLAHQGARVPAEKREEFLHWLEHLEYEVYGLPREGMVIYLRVPAEEAQRLVAQKAPRGYTKKTRDLQEADLRHLQEAVRVYDFLAAREGSGWFTVECFDAAAGRMYPPEKIHQSVMKEIGAWAHYIPWEALDDGTETADLM